MPEGGRQNRPRAGPAAYPRTAGTGRAGAAPSAGRERVRDRLEVAALALVGGPEAERVAVLAGRHEAERRAHRERGEAPVAAELVAAGTVVGRAGLARELAPAGEHGEQPVDRGAHERVGEGAGLARRAEQGGDAAEVDRDLLVQPQLRVLPGERLHGLAELAERQLGEPDGAAGRAHDRP